MIKRRAFFAVLAVLLFALPVHAAPILVTTGSAIARTGATGGPFTLNTGAMLLSGAGNWSRGSGAYLAGATVHADWINSGLDLRSGPGTVGGIDYSRIFYEGVLKFEASS